MHQSIQNNSDMIFIILKLLFSYLKNNLLNKFVYTTTPMKITFK